MSLRVEIEKRLGNFALQAEFETREQTLALLGASGCGKSVTLKCIAGIMTPDKGRIELDGQVLFDAEKGINLPPQKRRVGYLFQQYALFPNMTVVQNIRCGIRARGAERERLVREQMRRFQLEGLEKSYPAQLSGGQQQRVALARILAGEPKAILLDEPFSALDSYLKWSLEAELTQMLAAFSGPLVWVSHDLGECWRNCRTVCVLEQGRTGPVTDLETLVHVRQRWNRPGLLAAGISTPCGRHRGASGFRDGRRRCRCLIPRRLVPCWEFRRRRCVWAAAARPGRCAGQSGIWNGPKCCCSRKAQRRMRRCCAPVWTWIRLCRWGRP